MSRLNADVVIWNGRIATLDEEDRFFPALAVKSGRVVALGDESAMEGMIGDETEIIDLDGRTAIPGIVDSHCHPDSYAARLKRWRNLEPTAIASRDALLSLIDQDTAQSSPTRWFVGYRLNENESGGYPTLAELDRAGNGRPIFLLRTDGHIGLTNSAGFAACGIGADEPDPPFGRFDRDPATGRFTGLLRETAAQRFVDHVHNGDSEADVADGLEAVFKDWFQYGITSVYNSLTPRRSLRAYQKLYRERRLKMRVGVIASGREEGLIDQLIEAGIQSGFGDDMLKMIGVEWCPDCSTSGRTAAYYDPYVGKRVLGEPDDNRGMLLYDAEDLQRRAVAAHLAGHLVCIEGVGDRGIDFALDAIEAALTAKPTPDHRMRVEHCCYVTPPLLERLERLGAVDSSATGFMYELGDAYIANRGAGAMQHMWPHRALIDAGIPAPGHSDAMVCQANPFTALWSMVTRKTASGQSLDRSQAITATEALRAYTTLGAWSGREETIKGSLEIGKLADIAILDRDYFAIPKDAIRTIQVDQTLIGGETVWQRVPN